MKPLYTGVRNETQKNEPTLKQPKLQTRQPHQQKERQTHAHEGWLSLINDQSAWEKRNESSARHYPGEIDPIEFLGAARPFSWE